MYIIVFIYLIQCRAKPKGSIWLLYKWSYTSFLHVFAYIYETWTIAQHTFSPVIVQRIKLNWYHSSERRHSEKVRARLASLASLTYMISDIWWVRWAFWVQGAFQACFPAPLCRTWQSLECHAGETINMGLSRAPYWDLYCFTCPSLWTTWKCQNVQLAFSLGQSKGNLYILTREVVRYYLASCTIRSHCIGLNFFCHCAGCGKSYFQRLTFLYWGNKVGH